MRTTEEVLALVPNTYREAAMALGISQWRVILQIIVRTASKGIVDADVELMGRRLAGHSVGLVLSGGGVERCPRLASPTATKHLSRVFAINF
jgi:phosphate transport system permease protein